jgi:hypothetical protein
MLPVVALAVADDQWLYTRIGDVDGWMYVAYGMHWTDPSFADWYYKASRLPWILTNVVFQRLLGTTLATPAIQLACLAALASFNFALVRRFFGDYVAVIAAIMAVIWTQNHGAVGGADYHNTLCGPLFTASFYLTVRFVQERKSPIWFAGPAALYAALIFTNPLYLNLTPTYIVLGLVAAREHDLSRATKLNYVLLSIVCAVFGTLLTTVALGLVNLAVGRPFLFFLNQLRYLTSTLAGGGAHGWWEPWKTWVPNALPYFAPLIVLSAVSTIEIARIFYLNKRSRAQEWALALHGLYLFYFAVCVIGQSAGQTLLQPNYLAYPIWEMWTLAVIAVIGVRLPTQSLQHLSYTDITSLGLLSVGGALWLIFGSTLFARMPWSIAVTVVVAIGCAYLIFFFLLVAKSSWHRSTLALALLFPIVNMLTGVGELYAYSVQSCPYGRDGNEILVRISRFATTYAEGKPERVYLWLDEQEPISLSVDCPLIIPALEAWQPEWAVFRDQPVPMWFVSHSLIGFMHKTVDTPFPIKPISGLSDDAMREAIANGVVAIVSNDFNNVAAMQNRYSNLGIMTQLIANQRFNGKTLDLTVYVLQKSLANRSTSSRSTAD